MDGRTARRPLDVQDELEQSQKAWHHPRSRPPGAGGKERREKKAAAPARVNHQLEAQRPDAREDSVYQAFLLELRRINAEEDDAAPIARHQDQVASKTAAPNNNIEAGKEQQEPPPGVPLEDWEQLLFADEQQTIYTREEVLRFLASTENDVPAAVRSFRATVRWREARKRNAKNNFLPTALQPPERLLMNNGSTRFLGFAHDGYPVVWSDSRLSRPELVDPNDPEFTMYCNNTIYMMEALKRVCLQRQKLPTFQIYVLMDFSGWTFRLSKHSALQKTLVKLLLNHYPGTQRGTFIINAPPLFQIAWSIFRAFAPSNTCKKIFFLQIPFHSRDTIVGDEENFPFLQQALFTKIPKEILPFEYGGSNQFPVCTMGPGEPEFPTARFYHQAERRITDPDPEGNSRRGMLGSGTRPDHDFHSTSPPAGKILSNNHSSTNKVKGHADARASTAEIVPERSGASPSSRRKTSKDSPIRKSSKTKPEAGMPPVGSTTTSRPSAAESSSPSSSPSLDATISPGSIEKTSKERRLAAFSHRFQHATSTVTEMTPTSSRASGVLYAKETNLNRTYVSGFTHPLAQEHHEKLGLSEREWGRARQEDFFHLGGTASRNGSTSTSTGLTGNVEQGFYNAFGSYYNYYGTTSTTRSSASSPFSSKSRQGSKTVTFRTEQANKQEKKSTGATLGSCLRSFLQTLGRGIFGCATKAVVFFWNKVVLELVIPILGLLCTCCGSVCGNKYVFSCTKIFALVFISFLCSNFFRPIERLLSLLFLYCGDAVVVFDPGTVDGSTTGTTGGQVHLHGPAGLVTAEDKIAGNVTFAT
ncbi:unnamed protein product [Amoebophrya sp. A120]|nr:unnamed protein product [Amoebophrya sp. A120]|eukprot:GSA120T00010649001.1